MKTIAAKIVTQLEADANVVALVSDRIYWGIGKQNQKESAIIFSIEEVIAGATRDTRKFTSTVRCYGEDMDVASDIYEAVKSAMIASGHKFQGGQGGITDDEEREAAMELIFNLN